MMIIDMKATGKRIKELCMKKGLKPQMVADKLGFTSTAAIYKWFAGESLPTVDHLVELASILEVSVDDLLVTRDTVN